VLTSHAPPNIPVCIAIFVKAGNPENTPPLA
jgi:hypothetical protein